MTASAHDIAAALRERLPGLPTLKLHKLLYYCQGHHLATFGEPLFVEPISAWDMGPVVQDVWAHEKNAGPRNAGSNLGEAQLNTIGYVLSRYGGMTGIDLARLSHGESPWQRANMTRRPRGSVTIQNEWIREYFADEGAPEVADEEAVLDSAEVSAWLDGALARRAEPLRRDDPGEIRARLVRG